MPDTTDPAASALAEAKRIADGLHFACRLPGKVPDFTSCGGPAAEAYWAFFTPARIVSLLAAIEAPLKLADDWDAKAREIATQITSQDTEGAVAGFKMIGVTRYQEGAKSLRSAITAALAGKEASDDRPA